jgi:hypothetical protein
MLTMQNPVYPPLECVWILTNNRVVCQWVERKAPVPVIECRPHLSVDRKQMVA